MTKLKDRESLLQQAQLQNLFAAGILFLVELDKFFEFPPIHLKVNIESLFGLVVRKFQRALLRLVSNSFM